MDISNQVFDQMYDNDAFSQWLGISLVSIDKGTCTIKMKVRDEMLNGFEILHGGVAFSLADSAFAFASNSHNRLSVSLNSQMYYGKSVKSGQVLFATAKELRLGHRTADYSVEVSSAEGEVYYRFSGQVYRKDIQLIED